MNKIHGTGAFGRLAFAILAFCALFGGAGAFAASVTVDTNPPQPRVGDYVTLQFAGTFDREDFWVTEASLWELRPAAAGEPFDFIAEVDVFYHWSPKYKGPNAPTPFTATVGLGQFARAAIVEVRVRFFPMGGVPPYFDMDPLTGTISIGAGNAVCSNELLLGSTLPSCMTTLPFGTLRFGERSGEIPVVVRNVTRDVIYFGAFESNNADYGVTRRCGETLEPGATCEVGLTFAPSIDGNSPGRFTLKWAYRADAIPFQLTTVALTGDARAPALQGPGSGTRVVEYTVPSIDRYFMTGNEAEMAILDNASSGWRRTGVTFLATGQHSVCRFVGDPRAGPMGHFFEARLGACDVLKAQDSITPQGRPVYRYEGIAYQVGLPLLASNARFLCPDSSRAIYQFRRPAGNGRDEAYRWIPAGSVQGGPNGDDIARTLLQSGWSYLGHDMCSGTLADIPQ